MLRINNSLFPTDGSPCAEYAHAHAAYLANQFDARLHVLHVVEARTNNLDDLSEVIQIREQDILEQLRMPVPPGGDDAPEERITREKRTNASAAGGILAYADEHDVDLIVLGTHGRRGVDRLLMGSVAEEVVRLSECPVLTVCGKKQPAPSREINRILVPMGLSDHTDALFAHARAIASTYDARLDLLHVIESAALPAVYGVEQVLTDSDEVRQRVQRALEQYVEAARKDDVEAHAFVREGNPAQVILDFIEEEPIDLVTIATHGRTGVKRLLMGSVAEKVVRMAACPVFTVKSFGKSLVATDAVREAQA